MAGAANAYVQQRVLQVSLAPVRPLHREKVVSITGEFGFRISPASSNQGLPVLLPHRIFQFEREFLLGTQRNIFESSVQRTLMVEKFHSSDWKSLTVIIFVKYTKIPFY